MNKQELIEHVSQKTHQSKSAVLGITESLIETIESALKKGEKVQLAGFGSWQKQKRSARTGRNPKTGATLQIPAKNTVKFHASPQWVELMN
jgi:DNA-binding protein HU-beta